MADTATPAKTPVWVILAAVAVGGLFYLGGKRMESMPRPPATITVTGEGRAFVTPDIGEVSVGVQTGRVQTADQAMAKLKEGMDAVFAAVKAEGVEEKDIRTENFWLNPIYDWTEQGQVFRGFEGSQSLRIKVRDMDKVSDVLGAATKAGANQAGGVTFTVDDPEAKRAEAREEAIEEAKEKAKTLANQLGVSLGEIQGFNENGSPWGGPIMMMQEAYGRGGATAPAADMASIPLPPGEQEMHVTVSITYEVR